MWRNVGRHSRREQHRFAIDGEFELSFQHVAPLLMEMAVLGQHGPGDDRKMPERLLLRMAQRAINAVPDFDYFIGFKIDERHGEMNLNAI